MSVQSTTTEESPRPARFGVVSDRRPPTPESPRPARARSATRDRGSLFQSTRQQGHALPNRLPPSLRSVGRPSRGAGAARAPRRRAPTAMWRALSSAARLDRRESLGMSEGAQRPSESVGEACGCGAVTWRNERANLGRASLSDPYPNAVRICRSAAASEVRAFGTRRRKKIHQLLASEVRAFGTR